jgi:uncharacterized protein (TIGR03437 family)
MSTGDGGPATSGRLKGPSGIALDGGGSLYVADNGSRIRKVSPVGVITTIAGGQSGGYSGDGGPATNARMQLFPLTGMATDRAGDLFVVEQLNSLVRKISAQGVISTLARVRLPSDPAFPAGLAINAGGDLFVADAKNRLVRRIDSAGNVSTFADSNANPHDRSPYAIAVDGANNVYVSYSDVFGITKYSPNGNSTELAPAVFGTTPIGVDAAGNIYGFTRDGLVKITPAGAATPIGSGGYSSFPVDGSPAMTGEVIAPTAIAVDSTGNVFIVDSGSNAVFKLSPMNGPLPPSFAGVLNGAYGVEGPIAPGEIVTLSGSGMGPADRITSRLDDAGLVSTKLGDSQVFFDGKPAPLVYVSATQIAVVVPYGVSGATTVVTVSYGGRKSSPVTVPVAWTAPGLSTTNFSGIGQTAPTNEDGSLNSPAQPAAIGSVITLFATGEGQTMPAGIDGKLAGDDPLPSPLLPVTLTIGGYQAAVLYAGGARGQVAGVMQIDAQIPTGIAVGDAVPVVLEVGDVPARAPITIAVR